LIAVVNEKTTTTTPVEEEEEIKEEIEEEESEKESIIYSKEDIQNSIGKTILQFYKKKKFTSKK
jgi:hypothetical protein